MPSTALKKTVIFNGIAVGEVDATGDDDRDMEAVRSFLDARGLRKEITPFMAAYNAALAFANTSAYLYERDLRRPPRRGHNIAPFVVNAAFGIELYFKALALKHGKTLRGHKLVQLHKALPQSAMAAIEAVTLSCAADRRLPGPPDFPAYVRHLDDVYSEWRYYFEKQRTTRVEVEPTIFVMQVLHAACCLKTDA